MINTLKALETLKAQLNLLATPVDCTPASNAAALDEGAIRYAAGERSGYYSDAYHERNEPKQADRADMETWQIQGEIDRLSSLMFDAARLSTPELFGEADGKRLDDLLETLH